MNNIICYPIVFSTRKFHKIDTFETLFYDPLALSELISSVTRRLNEKHVQFVFSYKLYCIYHTFCMYLSVVQLKGVTILQ